MTKIRALAILCPVLAACVTNASNPVPEAEREFFFQSETDSLYVPGTDTLLTVYNDQQGVAIRDPNNPNKVTNFTPAYQTICDINGCKQVWRGHTFAGYSVAPSNGSGVFRFTRHDLVQPVAPSQCPSNIDCALIMRGDPSLATNGQRVLYGNLAYTDYSDIRNVLTNDSFGEFGPNAMALSRDESGTGTFPSPFVVFKIARPVYLDQGWVSMFGNAGVVAVHDARTEAVYLSTSDSTGTDSWSAPQFLFLPLTNNHRVRTIVRLRSETVGYIAYLETAASGQQPLDEFYNVVVVRITRNAFSSDWTAKQIFSDTGLTIASHAPGAGGHDWIDPIPISFAIGDGGRELHLVYRFDASIRHWTCRDEPLPTCDFNGNINVGWGQPETFLPVQGLTGTRYQPWVAADPTFGRRLATVFWYQQTSTTATTIANVGVLTGADAPMPHVPVQIFAPFEACVAGYNGKYGRLGEYASAAWTPYRDLEGSRFLWMVQYARSSKCNSTFMPGSITDDQFVFSTFFT